MGLGRGRYEVSAELTASTSVQEFSKIFEGLNSSERRGNVRLRVTPVRGRSLPRVLRLSFHDQRRSERLAAIDIDDDPNIRDPGLLEKVDIYFKRSLTAESAAGLDPGLTRKLQPLGLNNPAIGPGTAIRVLRARMVTGRNTRELALDARQLFALPSPRAFEIPPDASAEPLILFQTRLWSPATPDPGREEINEERAALIRTLRSAFGHRFLGGAIPTDFVHTHYPDLITPLPFSMRAYPRLLRRPVIAVYTRGLRDSLGFKMSEYLAASRCIVGHEPTTILPNPLVAGVNYLRFRDPEGCLAACEHLLRSPDRASAMRRANWDYYQAHVEPSAHVHALLDRAFNLD